MKIKNIFILTAMFAVFVLGTCSLLDGSGGQGSITINFDDSGARYAALDNDMAEMIYKVTLTSPGRGVITRETKKGAAAINIPVPEGIWNVQVDAEGDRVRGKGEASLTVTAGRSVSTNIGMLIKGMRVSTWGQLEEVFAELNNLDGKLGYLEEIEIDADADLIATSCLALTKTKTAQEITLWAKKNVTIIRGDTLTNDPVFKIQNSALILDGTESGEITIDGDKDNRAKTKNYSTKALINVETGGTLTMLEGVTITNNYNYYGNEENSNIKYDIPGGGGGVYVGLNGTFYMDGGTISNNKASNHGGGVYVYVVHENDQIKEKGTFKKTGGTISSNEVSGSCGGISVCIALGDSLGNPYTEKYPNPKQSVQYKMNKVGL
jgi:hypothetical protein